MRHYNSNFKLDSELPKHVTINDYKSFINMRVVILKENWYFTEGESKPTIECPKCGEGILGDVAPHRISDNGNVDDSVVCQNPNCDFHAMIQLENYQQLKSKL